MQHAAAQPSVLPGFGLTFGFTTFFLSADRAAAAGRAGADGRAPCTGPSSSHVVLSRARRRLLPAVVRRLAAGGHDQPGVRLRHRLDAGALRVPGPQDHRRAHRHAVRAADGGLGHRAHHGVRAERLDRPVPRAARHQGGLHLDRRHRRAHPDRHAVRGAHGAAGAAGGAARSGGCGRDPRRRPLLRLPAHHPADRAAGAAHRLHAGLRARGRRVRLGHLHRRQPADEDRDHAAADRHPARGVRLPGRRGARLRDAGDLLRHAARHQPAAGLGPAAATCGAAR